MTTQYPNVCSRQEHFDNLPFALETEHGWALVVRPSNSNARHWMAVGSHGITFHNIDHPFLDHFFSREDIREAAVDFHLSPRRTIEQHLFKMWD